MTLVRSRLLVAAGVLTWGVVAAWVGFDPADVHLWLPDLVVGWVMVGAGLIGVVRRPASRCGALMVAAGLTWFLGNFAGVHVGVVAWLADQLVYLHRGFLVHLLLTYPHGAASSRRTRVAIAVGYLAGLLPPVWDYEPAAVTL